MIVDDKVRITLIEGGEYSKGEYVSDSTCSVENGKVVITASPSSKLYFISSSYKTIFFKGEVNGDIIAFDENDNVIKVFQEDIISVPSNCKGVYFPVVGSYEFQLFTSEKMEVANMMEDLDTLEVILSRDGTSGVLSEVTMEFSFVLEARKYIRDIFRRNGLHSKVTMFIYRRESYSNDYKLVKDLELDFGTYQLTSDRLKISAAKGSLVQLINSAGKTEYDIKVSEVADSIKWNYGRSGSVNNATYEIIDSTGLVSDFINYLTPTITASNVELTTETIDYVSQEFKQYLPFGDRSYIAHNVSDKEVVINLDISMDIRIEGEGYSRLEEMYRNTMFFEVVTWTDADNPTIQVPISIPLVGFYDPNPNPNEYSTASVSFMNHVSFSGGIHLLPGEKLSLALNNRGVTLTRATIFFSNHVINAYDIATATSKAIIKVIEPSVLFQSYLDKMSGKPGYYNVSIDWEEKCMVKIVAAESIRGFADATIHGKPNDFINWMKVLGYEYLIDGREMKFLRRDKCYKTDIIESLYEDEVADLIESANEEYAYTTVEIGYEEQDNDTENGRVELNGLFTYTTDYVSREDNKLSLISHYRADSMGIEKLLKEADDSKDDKADNDIFFVGLTLPEYEYEEYKEVIIYDEKYGLQLFNGVFAPPLLVERNLSLIGINAKSLKFRSTDRNRNARILGVEDANPYRDFTIEEGIFRPIVYNFAVGSFKDLPDDRNGLVEIDYKGEKYRGFIREIKKNYVKETEQTWELYAKILHE